jgi:hypothetical protein
MRKKVFIATGALALAGGLGTAVLSSSCDQDCTLEARASVLLTVTTQDGSALSPANVDKVWYRVSDEATPRAAVDTDAPDASSDLTLPDSEWKLAECADQACTQWVLGYETPGNYEIKASVCGETHSARAFVDMTADGCHVDTEEIEIMVDGDGCAAEDSPPITAPFPMCTMESRPSMVVELFDPEKGTPVQVTGDQVYATFNDESTAIAGRCLDDGCSIWAIGMEQEGLFTVNAEVCGKTSTMEVRVPKTEDGCHVDTQYKLMEVDSSGCAKPITAVAPPPAGPMCDRMAHPSAMIFVSLDHGDAWEQIETESVWFEHDGRREKATCLGGDCSLGLWIAGWEQEGRFKAHTEVCGKQFSTEYAVPKTEDGCHVQTQYLPLMVDKEACPKPH